MKPEVAHTTVPDTEDYPPQWRGKSTEDLLHTKLISQIRWHRHPMYWFILTMKLPIFIVSLIMTPIAFDSWHRQDLVARAAVRNPHDRRFPRVGDFLSYARLVTPKQTSDGKVTGHGGGKIGNVHLKWAFSESVLWMLSYSDDTKAFLKRKQVRQFASHVDLVAEDCQSRLPHTQAKGAVRCVEVFRQLMRGWRWSR